MKHAIEAFEAMIDECYPPVIIGGVTFSISEIIRELNETLYREMFNEFIGVPVE